jgi:hypothetical protein
MRAPPPPGSARNTHRSSPSHSWLSRSMQTQTWVWSHISLCPLRDAVAKLEILILERRHPTQTRPPPLFSLRQWVGQASLHPKELYIRASISRHHDRLAMVASVLCHQVLSDTCNVLSRHWHLVRWDCGLTSRQELGWTRRSRRSLAGFECQIWTSTWTWCATSNTDRDLDRPRPRASQRSSPRDRRL